MSATEKWMFHVLALLVSVSGVVYLWMKYFLTSADPFSVVNHPLQPLMLQIHILAAPAFILMLGIILESHVLWKIKSGYRPNRRSGLVSLATFGVMVVSGYLLQVAAAPVLVRVALIAHLASSATFVISYVVHLIISVRLLAHQNSRRKSGFAAPTAA